MEGSFSEQSTHGCPDGSAPGETLSVMYRQVLACNVALLGLGLGFKCLRVYW